MALRKVMNVLNEPGERTSEFRDVLAAFVKVRFDLNQDCLL